MILFYQFNYPYKYSNTFLDDKDYARCEDKRRRLYEAIIPLEVIVRRELNDDTFIFKDLPRKYVKSNRK